MSKYVEVDGYKFCRDDKTGYYLSSSDINGKRKRLHIYVWEKYNGTVPDGYHIHHIDFDKSNNDISNLQLMKQFDHLSLHGKYNPEQKRANLLKYAVPASKEWHASEEGHEWHVKHAKEVAEKTFAEKTTTLVCKNCGEEFQAYDVCSKRNDFCSGKCKAAWRRKSGVDDEQRFCIYCGKEFTINKYAKTKCCSKQCSAKQRWLDRKKNQSNS